MRGVVWALQGEWDHAAADTTESAELAGKIGNTYIAAYSTMAKGFALCMSGASEPGKTLMSEGLSRATEGGGEGMPVVISWHAEATAMVASNAIAREIIADASASAEKTGQKVGRPSLHRARAFVAAKEPQPDWDQVDAHMRKGIQLAQGSGARPDLAISHFRYAELLHQKDSLEQAREQLEKASALFREMGMTWWLEQAETLRGRLEAGRPFAGFAPYTT
jgi:hypothetical protein